MQFPWLTGARLLVGTLVDFPFLVPTKKFVSFMFVYNGQPMFMYIHELNGN
jgi:hypothetical protein